MNFNLSRLGCGASRRIVRYVWAGFIPLFIFWSAGWAFGQDRSQWEYFRSRFLSPDGRVIDFQNGQISHSEGQGYGMLLAALLDDIRAFEKMRLWAKNNLQVRKNDLLHAWRWGLRPNGKWAVIDHNNATDGDLLIAWAILEGYRRWKEEPLRKEALGLLKDIREHLVLKRREAFILLPAYYGFSHKEEEILNPSYWIFPAFRHFASADDSAFWMKIHSDSFELLRQARFGSLSLPGDWIRVGGGRISLAEERSRFFGFEAVRILLHLSWEGKLRLLPGAHSLLELAKRLGYVPMKVDLTNDQVSLHEASAGIYAIYSRLARDLGEDGLHRSWEEKAREKIAREKEDYYSHVLYLLSQTNPKP